MATFIATYGHAGSVVKIHAAGCRYAVGSVHREAWAVEGAKTAEEAREIEQRNADEIGFTVKICPCAASL